MVTAKYVVVLGLIVFLGACATTTSVMKSWVGQPEAQVLASWGAPDRTAALPDGSKVDTWVTTWNNDYGLQTCRKTFTVDSEGKIIKWSYSNCGLF